MEIPRKSHRIPPFSPGKPVSGLGLQLGPRLRRLRQGVRHRDAPKNAEALLPGVGDEGSGEFISGNDSYCRCNHHNSDSNDLMMMMMVMMIR